MSPAHLILSRLRHGAENTKWKFLVDGGAFVNESPCNTKNVVAQRKSVG